jgi:Uma2 family endonuclease
MGRAVAINRLPASQEEFEDWCLGPEGPDVGHFEFLMGCVVAEPPASWPHGLVGGSIGERLASFVKRRRLGLFFDASQGFALPSGDTLEPDAAVVLRGTWDAAPAPTPGRFLRVVPDLVVEVLSPRTARRDQGVKREIYERNGVREYWLLDARPGEIVVLARDASGRFAPACTATGGAPARSVLLPGFAVRPSDVFP